MGKAGEGLKKRQREYEQESADRFELGVEDADREVRRRLEEQRAAEAPERDFWLWYFQNGYQRVNGQYVAGHRPRYPFRNLQDLRFMDLNEIRQMQ